LQLLQLELPPVLPPAAARVIYLHIFVCVKHKRRRPQGKMKHSRRQIKGQYPQFTRGSLFPHEANQRATAAVLQLGGRVGVDFAVQQDFFKLRFLPSHNSLQPPE